LDLKNLFKKKKEMGTYKADPLFDKTGTGNVRYKIGMIINSDVAKVWDNITRAENLKKYYTTDAKKNLDRTGEVLWAWGDAAIYISVISVDEFKKVVFEWNGTFVDYKVTVEISLEPKRNKVVVMIKETGWENDSISLRNAFANCNAWSDFLNALKVFTEHNINYLNK
jgi:uncharacterized protein YndB with AHSA1/START domain